MPQFRKPSFAIFARVTLSFIPKWPLRSTISSRLRSRLSFCQRIKKGQIAQKTEDKIGPYELHDFFLYYVLRFGFSPSKIFYLASQAYAGVYDRSTIKKWLREFFVRFFHNQFKRSCLPDGAKVGTVAISPRGDWRMPSDASVDDYLQEIDKIEA